MPGRDGPKCPACGHAPHVSKCTRKATSGCVPFATEDGGSGWLCGARPPCGCTVITHQSRQPEVCKVCHAQVWWAVGPVTQAYPHGVPVQVNHPSPGCPGPGPGCAHTGDWLVRRDAAGQLRARPRKPREGKPAAGEHRATTHPSTCYRKARTA